MATVFAQGHDLTLKIGSDFYTDICASATLTVENDQQVIETLAGRSYKTVAKSGTLDVELYQDWASSGSSLCKTLWTAANTSPDSPLTAILKVAGATGLANVYTFSIFPTFPPIGGAANDVLTTSVSFVVEDGSVVLTTV